jgi:pimeloyl-ACP methyl ester carboxylesterase
LIADGGGPAVVLGFSSGAVLAMDATAAGLPISHLALFEPPFVVNDARPPLPGDYVERLDRAVAEGRRDDAVALFMTAAVGMPPEAVEGMKQTPYWPSLVEIAHTIAYDGRIMGTTMSGNPLPTDRWAAITIPALVMYGERTWPTLVDGAKAAADALATARLLPVDGEEHTAPADVLAPVLREFAGA